MLIDTHCHLDFKDFDPDRDEAIKRAKSAGVEIILNVGSSLEGSRRAVELAEKYDFIFASVGVHPHDAQEVNDAVIKELKNLTSSKKVLAIGEVGLDYYRDLSPRNEQKKAFRKFIELSRGLRLPLILHNRDSHEDMISILKESFRSQKAIGVMHCFSGDEKFLDQCLELGLHISFTCTLTFKNAGGLRALCAKVPLERIMLETDAPFLAPQAYRGKRNEPAYVKILAEEVAKIHSLTVEDIARITTHNANGLFGFGVNEGSKVAYPIRDSLYLNITNRCTSKCYFCTRAVSDFVKGHRLKLDEDPSAKQILDAAGEPKEYKEIVFCGYGEPTLRLDVLKKVAAAMKQKGKKVRLVTNGHGNLINKRSIANELRGLVDKVSVSLNVDTKEKYNEVCKPEFGENTFEEVKYFIRECKTAGIEAEVTCLDIPEADIEKCRAIAEKELGVMFRLRKHNVVG